MITPIPPTVLPKQVICQGDTYEWLDGDQYNTTQLLTYTYQTPIGCDSTVNQQLVVKPEEKDAVPGAGQGWDGRFRKQKAAPGVYAWVTVLVFKGGAKEQYTGDVTLLR